MHLHKLSPRIVGLIQAVAAAGYILLLAFIVQTAMRWMDQGGQVIENRVVAMSLFLMVFVFSALTCGGAVLGYPLVLLFEKNAKRAISVICWSAVWLAIFLVIGLLISLMFATVHGYSA